MERVRSWAKKSSLKSHVYDESLHRRSYLLPLSQTSRKNVYDMLYRLSLYTSFELYLSAILNFDSSLSLPFSLTSWTVFFEGSIDAVIRSLNSRLIFPTLERCRIDYRRPRTRRGRGILSALRGPEGSVLLGPRSAALSLPLFVRRIVLGWFFKEGGSNKFSRIRIRIRCVLGICKSMKISNPVVQVDP